MIFLCVRKQACFSIESTETVLKRLSSYQWQRTSLHTHKMQILILSLYKQDTTSGFCQLKTDFDSREVKLLSGYFPVMLFTVMYRTRWFKLWSPWINSEVYPFRQLKLLSRTFLFCCLLMCYTRLFYLLTGAPNGSFQ